MRYIAENIDKGIQAFNVTDQAALSKSALQQRFKAATGLTIKEEIDRLRVLSAQRLLQNRNLKIKEVHQQAGFSSALHMRRVFIKLTGSTPGQYRKNME